MSSSDGDKTPQCTCGSFPSVRETPGPQNIGGACQLHPPFHVFDLSFGDDDDE